MLIGLLIFSNNMMVLRLFKKAIEDQIAMESQMINIYEFEPDGLLEQQPEASTSRKRSLRNGLDTWTFSQITFAFIIMVEKL